MAPRLSRWVALTAIAACVIATVTLTTGGTPIVFLNTVWYAGDDDAHSRSTRQIWELQMALDQVRVDLAKLDMRDQMAMISARTEADPLVLRKEGSRLVVDAPGNRALDSLWRRIPARRNDVRSVIIRGEHEASFGSTTAHLDTTGTCLVWTNATRSYAELVMDMRDDAGECLFAEQFGAPGKGVRAWQKNVWALSWDRSQPRRRWYRDDPGVREWSSPAWFQSEAGPSFPGFRNDWRELVRLEMSCLAGRSEHCEAASGLGEGGWPQEIQRGWYGTQLLPQSQLPRDILQEVGADRFGEIWRSDDPIAVSYARATGTPMAGWLLEWAQRNVGTIRRDNGLSLVGWLGGLLWISLLSLLTVERLKQRTAA